MARASLKAQIDRLKLGDSFAPADAERLIDTVALALNVFIGRERSRVAAVAMRRALAVAGDAK
jgi:hypothetical protein